jgi:3-deoxy-D-manno-octulosonic-acid transferase
MLALSYRLLTDLGAPIISLYLLKRRLAGREDRLRFRERKGYAGVSRPAGKLIWCHAASVGEAASLLTLIQKIREDYPPYTILVTTGSVTSAKMLEQRLPTGIIHQFVPVDRAVYVKRFLNTWRPDVALWVESELWPNTLAELRRRKIPSVLLNGRMSATSFRNWYRFRGWARQMLASFDLCLVQSDEARGRYIALGAKSVELMGNLKYAAKPLPYDIEELGRLQRAIGERPIWGMISTHRGEEAMAIKVHQQLAITRPNIVTVIVPRHPMRGDEIARLITEEGISFARRSRGEPILPDTGIYLVDTMGELGLFYRLCAVSVIGGSFISHGGHNVVEAAQLGTAIIFGPSMFNFTPIVREFLARKAAIQLQSDNQIVPSIERLLNDPAEHLVYVKSAKYLAASKRSVLDDIMVALKPYFETVARVQS